jgi:thiamine-phosphate pyrophosphorylase
MDSALLRILDANLNRAREGLRVLEEHARLGLDDAGLTSRLKNLRHALAAVGRAFGDESLLAARDIQHDVGTNIDTESERTRADAGQVVTAAAKRVGESLRCLEEYGKILSPDAAASVERLRYEVYAVEQEIFVAAPRRARLKPPLLHVLVTEELCRGPWFDVCRQAVAGGAEVLQLREKSVNDRELLARARRLRELTAESGALLFVNDRPDIARLAGADGVHVGQSDLPVAEVRRIAGPRILVGVSTHGVDEARAALAERPDYIAVGPMFPSNTKPRMAVPGPALLAAVVQFADVPVVAIGGITTESIAELSPGGRFHAAVCQAVIAAVDPATSAAELKRRLSALNSAAGMDST